jgi:cyclopropane-fatty-acyl-phospholipid synthase
MKPSIVPAFDALDTPVSELTWLQRLGRRALFDQFARIADGRIRVLDSDGEFTFGRTTPRCGLAVDLRVRHPQFYADAAFGGTLGAGEAYIKGYWDTSDLTALVRILVVNHDVIEAMEGGLTRLAAPLQKLLHWLNRNSKAGSARNIAAHYDLGNDMFQLFLDETMAYSCGIFEKPESTLYEASVAKFDTICRKLELKPTDHLVEIGTGWGGFAIHAAKNYGCHVTTTTISREQHDLARERIQTAGLADRITLLLNDYRDLRGQFDKLVSIEMIEAVGHKFLDTFFAKCGALLKPTGMFLLQAITIRDQFYQWSLGQVDFIQKFIFPGCDVPSVTVIADSVTRSSDMKLYHLQDIGPHYATTLRLWRERFFANIDKVRALGYPETFIRMWEFYLAYCEGGYAERQLGNVQMLFTKPDCRRAAIAFRG